MELSPKKIFRRATQSIVTETTTLDMDKRAKYDSKKNTDYKLSKRRTNRSGWKSSKGNSRNVRLMIEGSPREQAQELTLDEKTSLYRLKHILSDSKLFNQIQVPRDIEDYVLNGKCLKEQVTIDMLPLNSHSIVRIRLASRHRNTDMERNTTHQRQQVQTFSPSHSYLQTVPDLFQDKSHRGSRDSLRTSRPGSKRESQDSRERNRNRGGKSRQDENNVAKSVHLRDREFGKVISRRDEENSGKSYHRGSRRERDSGSKFSESLKHKLQRERLLEREVSSQPRKSRREMHNKPTDDDWERQLAHELAIRARKSRRETQNSPNDAIYV